MKNDKIYKSIVFKLIVSVVIIFILMITFTNYMINRKQLEMTEQMLYDIEKWIPKESNSVIVTVNNAHLQSTTDFRIYTFLVTGMVILLGSLAFAIIISKILEPLKNLQKNISQIDINKPDTFSDQLLLEDGSTEIAELSKSFNSLMARIYKDYTKQKDFSANVAHELRTPVAVMKAQVDVYRRKNTDPQAGQFLDRIDLNLNKLKNLIESVLMFSKNQEINLRQVCLRSLIDEILFDLEDKIAAKDIKVNFAPKEDICLRTDDLLLQRLIFNIIENSIKYNIKSGFIDIDIREDEQNYTVEVADGGIGLSGEQKEKIFDLFYQADDSRHKEGFGIGLALSKEIAESLGARIEVLDNEPRGSKFLIIFPKS